PITGRCLVGTSTPARPSAPLPPVSWPRRPGSTSTTTPSSSWGPGTRRVGTRVAATSPWPTAPTCRTGPPPRPLTTPPTPGGGPSTPSTTSPWRSTTAGSSPARWRRGTRPGRRRAARSVCSPPSWPTPPWCRPGPADRPDLDDGGGTCGRVRTATHAPPAGSHRPAAHGTEDIIVRLDQLTAATSPAAAFAATFVALFVAHQVADHWVQTSHQAAHKSLPGHEGRIACLAHVASYTLCTTLAVLVRSEEHTSELQSREK